MKSITLLIFLIALFGMTMGCALQFESQKMLTAPTEKTIVNDTPAETNYEPVPDKTVEVKTETADTVEVKTETAMTFEEEQAKAIEAAKKFVQSLDGYKDQGGRELQAVTSVKSGCVGCWIVELTFTRNLLYYPDKTEHIRVNVELKNWKMSTYTFG
jgi:hypothetical protein